MDAGCLISHWEFHCMGAEYLLTLAFNENWWVQLDLSQNRWVQSHPLTHPNDTPAFDMQAKMIPYQMFWFRFLTKKIVWHCSRSDTLSIIFIFLLSTIQAFKIWKFNFFLTYLKMERTIVIKIFVNEIKKNH